MKIKFNNSYVGYFQSRIKPTDSDVRRLRIQYGDISLRISDIKYMLELIHLKIERIYTPFYNNIKERIWEYPINIVL